MCARTRTRARAQELENALAERERLEKLLVDERIKFDKVRPRGSQPPLERNAPTLQRNAPM
jgi:hypothetical protein